MMKRRLHGEMRTCNQVFRLAKSKGSGWIDEESRSIGGLVIQQRKRW